MTQQICPQCRQANELSNQFCSRCGHSMAVRHLGQSRPSAMTVGSGSLLPAPSMRQVGQAVAVSLLALVAEVGIILLRRRVAQMSRQSDVSLVPATKSQDLAPEHNTIVSRRVVQFWRKGRLTSQVVEQSVYQEFD